MGTILSVRLLEPVRFGNSEVLGRRGNRGFVLAAKEKTSRRNSPGEDLEMFKILIARNEASQITSQVRSQSNSGRYRRPTKLE